jgi:superfamily II DNA or RNA helicase
VTSDDPKASARIAAFGTSKEPWLVSVLMVSEGVDIPRLRVGVYATPARTELFFRQVIGRFIRRTPGRGEQMSWVFLASDPRLKELAAAVEEERRHALIAELLDEGEEVERLPSTRDDGGFHALSSTGRLDGMLQTTNPGDQLGLFGGPPPPAAATLSAPVIEETSYERRERLRGERAVLVRELSQRSRRSHREIHAEVNRASGAPSVSGASIKQLEKGNAWLRKRL